MNMKFKEEPKASGIQVTTEMLKVSGLDGVPLEVHSLKGATVIIPGEMDAMELIQAADSLGSLHAMLLSHLAAVCGTCSHCSKASACPDLCGNGGLELKIPGWALEAAGIPNDAKLSCDVDEESGEIRVTQAEYSFDICDVPPHILEALCAAGVCLGTLDDFLISGEVIYD